MSLSLSPASSISSPSVYLSSCSSLSPPLTYHLSSVSPPPHRPNTEPRARDHLASLIRKHGPPTPVSSTSSLRKLTSTSPITDARSLKTPLTVPTAVDNVYVSSGRTQPIPIPRANADRSLADLPLTPLTGRFDHGLYLAEPPPASLLHKSSRCSAGKEKSTRKKRSAQDTHRPTSALSTRTRKMNGSRGPSLTMPPQSGPVSPKPSPKLAPMSLGNLPRFHPAVYQSPNNSPSQPQSPTHQRSQGYRVSSGASRDALRQYRELVAASVSLSRNKPSTSSSEISAPRLDPLGSPGPVTPLALEEAENYMAPGSAGQDDKASLHRQVESLVDRDRERLASSRPMDMKNR